ncbi:MAG TPA: B12-binding domain-containing radical SAM protein [Bacteroidales bacterium]|nr:MAG: B12-binding domain-containing radical SAM protein [Bacteroidetes bacterium GWF2_35_48]OFZ03052.1 MAG: B12-binding domain-containing radical SAM protein [Bacteroidetes bacterium RIFOXYC12_FULL_35_7]HBX49534.1 B12-binding domain-containing radical SAM protein [Bacteroidales bacterium]
MKILFVYPQYPDSIWSFKHALRFISKKAVMPPLGLITVSAMLPANWQRKLVDLNIIPIKIKDIQWADYVFISAMYIQRESVNKIIDECIKQGTKIIAGGPLFTQDYENYPQIDHLVLNEAEITLPLFLKDLEEGHPERIYKTDMFADITSTPIPDYNLLSRKNYAFMNIQVTRGCPFACEFCEITSLLGHKVRIKTTEQILDELQKLYELQWRGNILIVDDNFTGNKKVIKYELLPAMKKWMQERNYPFVFNTQASINLADDSELMKLMAETGFTSVFIGIETPEENSLIECNKGPNKNRDLLDSIKKIQRAGLQVSAGFIVGFDSDSPSVFQRQIDFIQQSGIVSAMVGLLNAPKNTRLYERLEAENRLTTDATGNNTDSSMNFIPRMNYQVLVDGHKKIIRDIYATKAYYKRIRNLLLNYKPNHKNPVKFDWVALLGFFKSILIIGIINRGRRDYWRFMLWTFFRRPALFVDAVTFSIYGYHFRTVYRIKNKYRN